MQTSNCFDAVLQPVAWEVPSCSSDRRVSGSGPLPCDWLKVCFANKLPSDRLIPAAPAQLAQVLAGTHPDLDVIAKPADRNYIPLQLLIGEKQHRLREGLCARIAMRPARGGRKVGIIDDADYLNKEGANCLLKTLEEPPASSLLILIGTSPQRQLPTIRSRCQTVRFQPLEHSICARLLRKLNLATDEFQAQQLATLCQGSLARAADWSDPGLCQFGESLPANAGRPGI